VHDAYWIIAIVLGTIGYVVGIIFFLLPTIKARIKKRAEQQMPPDPKVADLDAHRRRKAG